MLDGSTALTDSEFCDQLVDVLPFARGYARSLTRNDVDAEDLVQDAACNAWRARHQFHRGTTFKAWMFTIVRNGFLSTCRRGMKLGPMPSAEPSSPPGQIDTLLIREAQARIAALPRHQQDAILLIASGATYDQAAETMKCGVGTVKSRVSRARRALLGN